MEISQTGSSALQAASQDPVRAALQRPVERLEQQAESARVQLSAFGRLRSSAAAVGEAARAIQQTVPARSADETRSVAKRFVAAVNTGNQVAGEVTAGRAAGKATGVLADDGRARAAANELRTAVSGAGNAEELRRIGIDVARNGSLSINTQRFDQALQSDPVGVTQTLDSIGRRVESAAVRQNSSGGAIGRAVESLSRRVDSIEARRDEAAARAEESQRAVQKQASAITNNPFLVGGVAAYRGISGL